MPCQNVTGRYNIHCSHFLCLINQTGEIKIINSKVITYLDCFFNFNVSKFKTSGYFNPN